jgi:hypothetical protein
MSRTLKCGLLALSGTTGVALIAVTPALAAWTSSGIGSGGGQTSTLSAPTSVTVPVFSSPNVPVSWAASSGPTIPTGYYVTRMGSGGPAAACAGVLIIGTSCTDSGVVNGEYSYSVTAVYRSWTAAGAASGIVTVTTASALAFSTQPAAVTSMASITPSVTVQLRDSGGAAVSTAGISVTIAIGANPSGGTLSGTTTALTNAAGVATFAGLSIDKAGAGYTLTAAGTGLTSATSSAFTVTFGAAAQLAVTQSPTDSFAGTAFFSQPVVTIQDAAGNTVTNATTTVTVTAAGAGLACSPTAAVNGIATFTGCLAENAGTYTLTASAGALAGAVSASFTVVAAPTNLAWSGQTSTVCTASSGTSFALAYTGCGALGTATFTARVSLTNASGAVLTNLGPTVTVSFTASNGDLSTTTVTIPHGATVSTASVTFSLDLLSDGGITASSPPRTSATATLS